MFEQKITWKGQFYVAVIPDLNNRTGHWRENNACRSSTHGGRGKQKRQYDDYGNRAVDNMSIKTE